MSRDRFVIRETGVQFFRQTTEFFEYLQLQLIKLVFKKFFIEIPGHKRFSYFSINKIIFYDSSERSSSKHFFYKIKRKIKLINIVKSKSSFIPGK